ncbi:glycoside hydrolase family 1 protein [Aaosphaeria arxii CBS 175.79]|uniref:Glycoside hydrolase family 1 protein n=1 Tax=Aaosphaeria arxii CBS 175.79 TaxID=1450172 RepID=A0A6A5XIM6_9PLEO|nr:glycoside hydrolase family 1 protein [Aaosphaeria arxii CBS 175.79]KAF2012972.1 glycoside hydrolase family 1 protein [Aaosphaeria arxii CBS 175.79]
MFQAPNGSATYDPLSGHDLPAEELPLPSSFKWGTATAAYQIEGGAKAHGKGPSIWDEYTHRTPSRTSNQTGDVACDHYNRVTEDIDLMSSFNVDVYRFSLSWSRIIPLGGRDDPINEEGIAFYNNLIDQLLIRKIEPSVTLYHWDAPQALYDRYNGFLDTAEFCADFLRYARLCFERFGDRVKQWTTFNEPYIISIFGHLNGTLAPGHCAQDGFDTKHAPWRVGHTLIISHASVVQLYTKEFKSKQHGTVSIVLNGHFYEPYSQSEADKQAAITRLEFFIAWFGDPIFLGTDYPQSMRDYLGDRLPAFNDEEKALLRNTARSNGFYGMNHYSTKYARALTSPPADDDWTGNIEEGAVNADGTEIGPVSQMPWLRVAPEGFRKLLRWVWNRYHLPIIVTENGCPCPEDSVEAAVDDTFRQRYLGLYIDAISRSIYEDGVQVTGYYVWTLMDNFGK